MLVTSTKLHGNEDALILLLCTTLLITRERFNANIAIRARDRVAKSYKTDKRKQHKFRQLSIDLDKRLFILLRNGFRVSISTIEGRVKPKLAIGDYQRELLKNPVRDARLVYRAKEFYIHITVIVKIPEPSGNNPVGVDVGINKLLVASNLVLMVNLSKEGGNTSEILEALSRKRAPSPLREGLNSFLEESIDGLTQFCIR